MMVSDNLFALNFNSSIVLWNLNTLFPKIVSTQGGIRAVVWTDVVQGIVIVISMLLIAFYGIQKVGGVSEVWTRAVDGGRVTVPE